MSYTCSWCGENGHNVRTCQKRRQHMRNMSQNPAPTTPVKTDTLNKPSAGLIAKGSRVKMIDNHPYTAEYDNYSFEVESVDMDGKHVWGNTPVGNKGRYPLPFLVLEDSVPATQAVKTPKEKKMSQWELAEAAIKFFRLVLLYGPPGTGKTTAGNFVAPQSGQLTSVYNITLTDETPAAELRGHFVPKGGEFVWMDGPAVKPYDTGARLVLNEIDKASADALQFLHALLDDPDISYLTLPNGETITPGNGFSAVATMNGEPEDLPEALADRFAVMVHITETHPAAIATLPVDLQQPCRNNATGHRRLSIRKWKAFAQLREQIGQLNAARAVFGDDRAKEILDTLSIAKVSTEDSYNAEED